MSKHNGHRKDKGTARLSQREIVEVIVEMSSALLENDMGPALLLGIRCDQPGEWQCGIALNPRLRITRAELLGILTGCVNNYFDRVEAGEIPDSAREGE